MRTLLIIVFTFGLLTRAGAHAFLDHADPRVGATVTAPTEVKLWMTEELEASFSKVRVYDSAGREIDRGDTKVVGAMMSVALPQVPPGLYRVVWKAVAMDTHRTGGTFSFIVR